MQPHTHFYSLRLHSKIINQITYGLLTCSPILQQEPDYISIIHSLCGVVTIELIEGEPDRFSHSVIVDPRRTLNDFGFPFKVYHRAFYHEPMVVQSSLQIYTLLSEAPAHFDNCKVAGYQVKAVKFKSKNKTRMPWKLWQKGLKYGLSRITKNRCLSNGQEIKWIYEL